jgi:hypothetical protein
MLLPGPALECGYDEEREHGLEYVVVVEGVPIPHPLLDDRLVDVRVPDNEENLKIKKSTNIWH